MPGYHGNIMLIVDVSDPEDPQEVSRFWLPGQWIAGGERSSWPLDLAHRCQLHHPIVQGDRAYTAWFGLGGAIVDISDIKMPTLVSHFNYDMGGQNHTFLPIKNREFAVFISEWLRPLETYRNVVFGGMVVLLVIFMPQGITGLLFPGDGKGPLVNLWQSLRRNTADT